MTEATLKGPGVERFRVLALLMAFAGLCHFNRVSMSVAGVERLMSEFSLSETAMGSIYSAYLLTYTIFMTPGGWLIDRLGPKAVISMMGLGSAITVAMTAAPGFFVLSVAEAFTAFVIIRGLAGVSNVPMHPAAARSVSLWFPLHDRSWANGIVTATALVGISLSYPLFGALIDSFGWPAAFLICSVVTAIVGVTWMSSVREATIEEATLPDQSEVNRGPAESSHGRAPYASLALLTGSYAAIGYFQYLFFYWMQYYFERVLGLGDRESRYWSMIPTLAMAVGMVTGGWIARRLQEKWGYWRGLAALPPAGMFAGAILSVAGILVTDAWAVATCFSLALGAIGLAEGPFWTAAVAMGGKRGGASAAIFNTGGNAGGILAPVVTPLFSGYFGWQAGIALASLFCLIGATLWFWIEPPSEATE